jgi:hypothetical protein
LRSCTVDFMSKTTFSNPRRRNFLIGGILAVASALFGRKTAAGAAASTQATGDSVTTHMRRGELPVQPLDTMLLFERGDDNNGKAITHEVLSLIHQEKGKNSYPWTMYASLETFHENGDGCVVCSRLHKRGPGWSAGLHSEVFNHSRGVALGGNIEMSSDHANSAETTVIGLNIQAVGGASAMQHGIQIHDGANHFETGIHLNGKGQNGIDLAGTYQVGIRAGNNHIRLNEGACVELDEKGLIKFRYRKGRIEFLNGDRCFGHLDVNGEDHPL